MTGADVTHRVLSKSGERFENKQEVCCFCWYIFYKAAEKNQLFVSGSWLVQDPEHRWMYCIL